MALRTTEDTDTKLNPGQANADQRFNGQKLSDVANAEEAGTFNDSSDNPDKNANNVQDNSNIDNVKDAEENPAGPWNTNVNPSKPKGNNQPINIKGYLKKRGPIGAIIFIVAGGGFAFSGFFGAGSLLLHVAASLKINPLDATSSVLNSRGRRIMLNQLTDKAVSGICTPVTIRCKFETMSNRQIKALESVPNVKAVTKGRTLGVGRNKITSITVDDKPITAENLKAEMRTNPKLATAVDRATAPRLQAYASSGFSKVLKVIGSTKAANLPRAAVDKMKAAIKERVTGATQAAIDAKLTPTNDDSKPYATESGERLTAADAEARMSEANSRFKASLDLRNGAKATTEFFSRSSVKAGLIGVGAVSIACSAWNIVRTAEAASRYAGAVQLASYAMVFLNTADSIRTGDATPEQVEALGTILTTPNSAGVSAMESRGMKNILYGDVSPIPNTSIEVDSNNDPTDQSVDNMNLDSEVSQYVNGGGVGEGAKSAILQNIAGGGGDSTAAHQAADKTCGFINSTTGTVVMLGAAALLTTACVASALLTLGATVAPCFGDVGVQLGIAAAISGALILATNKINSLFSGNLITGEENGNQAGNALASGAGAINAFTGLASGLGYLDKNDAGTFQAVRDDAKSEFAALDRQEYSPLDSSNPNTFMGKLVTNMLPFLSKTSSIGSSLLSISKMPFASFSSMFSSASATQVDAGVCTDSGYEDIATDINCNPIVGQTTKTLSLDIEDVLDYMINNGHIDPASGAPVSTQYKDFITYCPDRNIAFGSHPDGDGKDGDLYTGKVCQDGYSGEGGDMYDMFRAYISYSIAEEGLSGEETQATTPATETTIPTPTTTDAQPLPTGTTQELARQILATGKVVDGTGQIGTLASGASVAAGNTDPRVLGVILGLARSGFSFNVSSMARNYVPVNGSRASWHLDGRAADISGRAGINGTPFNQNQPFIRGVGYGGGADPVALSFIVRAASYLPAGCQLGLPNIQYINAVKPLVKSGCNVFIDQGSGPHIHIGVPN